MKFERISSWCELSDCGRFSVVIARERKRFVYQACRRNDKPPATLLGTYGDIEEARAKCREVASA